MGKLTDILAAGGYSGSDFIDSWNNTTAAAEFEPLPPGEYICHAERGELNNSTKGKPRYCVTFKVFEGAFTGRLVWLDLYLTDDAKPYSKRDLLKLGIDEPAKLERPLPPGIRCKVKVALRRDDHGNEANHVRRFDVIGIDEPTRDAFAPDNDLEGGDDGEF